MKKRRAVEQIELEVVNEKYHEKSVIDVNNVTKVTLPCNQSSPRQHDDGLGSRSDSLARSSPVHCQ